MAEYIDREAARKELLDWCIITGYGGLTKYDVHTALDNIPAADVVEVVRCRECFYKKKAKANSKGFLICPASGMEITDNDYCSYGRRGGANDA